MRAHAWTLSLAALSFAAPALAQPALAPKATMADVAFIAGHWKGDMGGMVSEEVWTAPSGDNMVGMWRLVGGGKVKLFEFLNIVEEGDGPTFRLRHFDRAGLGWEEKDKPVVLKVVSFGPRAATFEGRNSENTGTVRLAYRRTADDAMTVMLEKTGSAPQDFTFRLATAMR